ncbi:hypothetical protein [Halarcobacter sp.]|uniref:hypothetical protein n=1 Tax=Halarcobacter sp. TaxID=2321133 RepID=UPI0029F48ED6|nr:hypothetical protein [Halarcobacter sp.]
MKKLKKIILILILPIYLFSHSIVLNLIDNEDGTITIVGMFNTGESAAGAMVKLIAVNSNEILFQKRLDDNSELTVNIPKIPYKVVLDGGAGHTVFKDGIPPKDGFKKVEQKKEAKQPSRTNMEISTSKATTYSIILAFVLLIATIIISILNTNRLMKELKQNR